MPIAVIDLITNKISLIDSPSYLKPEEDIEFLEMNGFNPSDCLWAAGEFIEIEDLRTAPSIDKNVGVSLYNGSLVNTVDITPSWSNMLHTMLHLLTVPQAKDAAMSQLKRMAIVADMHVEHVSNAKTHPFPDGIHPFIYDIDYNKSHIQLVTKTHLFYGCLPKDESEGWTVIAREGGKHITGIPALEMALQEIEKNNDIEWASIEFKEWFKNNKD